MADFETKKDIFTISTPETSPIVHKLIQGEENYKILLSHIAKVFIAFSIILFVALSINIIVVVCDPYLHELDTAIFIVGYCIVLLLLCIGCLIRKSLNDTYETIDKSPKLNEENLRRCLRTYDISCEWILKQRKSHAVLLKNISRAFWVHSLILFASLLFFLGVSPYPWYQEHTGVIIGYVLTFLMFGIGFVINEWLYPNGSIIKSRIKTDNRSYFFFTYDQVKKFITSLVQLKSKDEINESIQDTKFVFLGFCIILFGFVMAAGSILMTLFLVSIPLITLAMAISYSIWVVVQGSMIFLSSMWDYKSRTIMLLSISCTLCIAVNVTLIYDLYRSSGRYFNILNFIKENFNMEYYTNGRHGIVEKLKFNFQYPIWFFTLAVTLQKGSLLPLTIFLVATMFYYLSSYFRFARKTTSDKPLERDNGKLSKIKQYQLMIETIGLIFILAGSVISYSGVIVENYTSLLITSTTDITPSNGFENGDSYFMLNYGLINCLMCSILYVFGLITLSRIRTSKKISYPLIMMCSMIVLFAICIYSCTQYRDILAKVTRVEKWRSEKETPITWNLIQQNVGDKTNEQLKQQN